MTYLAGVMDDDLADVFRHSSHKAFFCWDAIKNPFAEPVTT
jgi:hypothetical protein